MAQARVDRFGHQRSVIEPVAASRVSSVRRRSTTISVRVRAVGLTIQLRDESGAVEASLDDPRYLFGRVLPDFGDPNFRHLCWIDPYGSTTFNRGQAIGVVEELERVRNSQTDQEAITLLDQVSALARRVRDEVHLYLVFIGD
jgi:hypothetical protein